jgi:5-methyltetrahydrofolate--homocysteine methyltransferase
LCNIWGEKGEEKVDQLEKIAESVRMGHVSEIKGLIQEALDHGVNVRRVLEGGLFAGMEVIGKLFKEEEIYVPEVLMAAKTMQAGMQVLEPLLLGAGERKSLGKIVLGTVKGDVHNLGKYLVGVMLKGVGFEVVDIGENITAEKFVATAKAEGARIIGMSGLLTTTIPYMKTVIEALEEAGLKRKIKTLIGGACVTQRFADEIGADGFGENASLAVEKAKALLGIK